MNGCHANGSRFLFCESLRMAEEFRKGGKNITEHF